MTKTLAPSTAVKYVGSILELGGRSGWIVGPCPAMLGRYEVALVKAPGENVRPVLYRVRRESLVVVGQ